MTRTVARGQRFAEKMATAPEVMDLRQAAAYLGVSQDTLSGYAKSSTVPGFKLGSRWRFKRSLLDEWMLRKSGAAPAKGGAR